VLDVEQCHSANKHRKEPVISRTIPMYWSKFLNLGVNQQLRSMLLGLLKSYCWKSGKEQVILSVRVLESQLINKTIL